MLPRSSRGCGGASTITPAGREAALQIEARHSKREIIEAYLNHVYYGRGAYGIEAAVRLYFGVSARYLDLAQASYLAGLPQLPGVYGEHEEAAAAQARQRYVLDRLVATGAITAAQVSEAARPPLTFAEADEPSLAPHFTQMVEAELASIRPDLPGQPGLVIQTPSTLPCSARRTDLCAHT